MSHRASSATSRIPVWVWYEYPDNFPPRYIRLNLQALQRNAPATHFNIIYVNHSTIGSHVPDLPDAFWRLPTRVAFSDAGRLGLLATHGGIYVDADFLVLGDKLELLQTWAKGRCVFRDGKSQTKGMFD